MSFVKVISDGIDWQEVGDEIVILDNNRAVYLRVSGSGKALWPMLTEGIDPSALPEALVTRYGIAHDLARRDCAAFVEQLLAKELISVEP